jgi:3-oxoacyl-[acyl-carrier protein] reductase
MQEIRVVDVLVNSAGIFSTCELDRENTINVLGVFHTNVLGYLHWIYAVLPGMQRRANGYIINIASMSAKRVRPGCSTYALTKAAICSINEAILKENVHQGIRATAICPGDCDTQMGRVIAPDAELIPTEDVARTVLWLLSLSKTSIVPEVCIERRGRY